MQDDKSGVDYAALDEEIRSGDEAAKLEVLKKLKGDPSATARALVHKLLGDESLRVRAAAQVHLKEGGRKAPAAAPGAIGTGRRDAGWQSFLDPEISWHIAVPLAAILALGFLSPPIHPAVFLFAYYFLILHIAIRFDKAIALPAAATVILIAATAYIFHLMKTFKPTLVTIGLFAGAAGVVSVAVSRLRDDLVNRDASIASLKTQLTTLKDLIEKKKSEKQAEDELNMIEKLREDLKAKTRRSLEIITQLNQLIAERTSNGVVSRIAKILEKQLALDAFSIWFIDPVKHELYPIFSTNRALDLKTAIPLTENLLLTKAVREGGTLRLDEIRKGEEAASIGSERTYPTVMAIALEGIDEKGKPKTVGAISIEDPKTAEKLSPEEFELLKAVARSGAFALAWSGDLELAKTDVQNIRQISEQEKEDKKRIKGLFGKFVAPSVVEEILKNPDAISLGGKRRKVTLFFADIRGFTAMSEKMADRPETVIEIVNLFLSTMTNIIINKGGTLDKYMGDALMALFGAPIDRPDDAYRAVEAAVAIRRETQKIWEKLVKTRKIAVNVGIGINTAEVVVGMVGSNSMMNYTAIGDGVNIASRIESNAKAGQILISRSTFDEVKDFIKYKELPPVQVKGKSQPIPVFEVEDITDMFLI